MIVLRDVQHLKYKLSPQDNVKLSSIKEASTQKSNRRSMINRWTDGQISINNRLKINHDIYDTLNVIGHLEPKNLGYINPVFTY